VHHLHLIKSLASSTTATAPAACHSTIVPIDALLQPCCATFEQLLEGSAASDGYGAGRNTAAIADSPQLQSFLTSAADTVKQVGWASADFGCVCLRLFVRHTRATSQDWCWCQPLSCCYMTLTCCIQHAAARTISPIVIDVEQHMP
jgi:hypothetical protein